jgi:hypothetical protein
VERGNGGWSRGRAGEARARRDETGGAARWRETDGVQLVGEGEREFRLRSGRGAWGPHVGEGKSQVVSGHRRLVCQLNPPGKLCAEVLHTEYIDAS